MGSITESPIIDLPLHVVRFTGVVLKTFYESSQEHHDFKPAIGAHGGMTIGGHTTYHTHYIEKLVNSADITSYPDCAYSQKEIEKIPFDTTTAVTKYNTYRWKTPYSITEPKVIEAFKNRLEAKLTEQFLPPKARIIKSKVKYDSLSYYGVCYPIKQGYQLNGLSLQQKIQDLLTQKKYSFEAITFPSSFLDETDKAKLIFGHGLLKNGLKCWKELIQRRFPQKKLNWWVWN